MKKSKNKLLLLISVGFLLWGCSSEAKYETITADKAKEMMDTKEVIVLDVRSQDEFNERHIENAINIDVNDIEKANGLIEKDQTILVYCQSGNRSKKASKKLVKMGYKYIYDFGGINDWTYGTVK